MREKYFYCISKNEKLTFLITNILNKLTNKTKDWDYTTNNNLLVWNCKMWQIQIPLYGVMEERSLLTQAFFLKRRPLSLVFHICCGFEDNKIIYLYFKIFAHNIFHVSEKVRRHLKYCFELRNVQKYGSYLP